MALTVSALRIAPVKGTAVVDVDRATIGPRGLEGDRRFSILDGEGGLVTALNTGRLLAVRAAADDAAGTLTLTFPDGEVVTAPVTLGAPASGKYFGERHGRLVEGPFSDALQRFLERPAHLIAHDEETDGWDEHAVSIVSRASIDELAHQAGRDAVDARRFRMSVEVDGAGAREEDSWVGREVVVGRAVLEVVARCERCVATTRDPDSGEVDFNALRVLAGYRGKKDVCMGVLCRVVEPGEVRVGDAVVPR